MVDDASRRDVMRALAGTVVVPPVSDVDLEIDHSEKLPDVGDNNPFWVLLYAAANVGDPDRADEKLLPILDVFYPSKMDGEAARDHVRTAARGEYDAEKLERRAAQAWALHTPSLE